MNVDIVRRMNPESLLTGTIQCNRTAYQIMHELLNCFAFLVVLEGDQSVEIS